jgi:DNA mismatch repair protein MutH
MFLKADLPYDPTNPLSIEEYAKHLENKCLKEFLTLEQIKTLLEEEEPGNKGGFGNLVEKLYFFLKQNSRSEPDFIDAGVELKTTPIIMKTRQKKYGSKERLVFNTIDFETEYLNTFKTSDFWNKNKLLLLMFYLYEKDKIKIEYIFKLIKLWKFPESDLKIIENDWNTIINKIKAGKAHEISEGDTLYLAACTKGKNKNSLRKQPFNSEVMAMQRGFALKSAYINFIIDTDLNTKSEAVVKNNEVFKKQTFEEYVIKKFEPYYGKTDKEIISILGSDLPIAKHNLNIIAKAIMGVKKRHVEEFEKAGILMKTIQLRANGTPKEYMSFKQVKYKEIVNQKWEDSDWYHDLTQRIFFVIFKANKDGDLKLEQVKFWTVPYNDLEELKSVWIDTKLKIKKGDYNNFIKASHGRKAHFKIKGRRGSDVTETADGAIEQKKAFWLNGDYIKSIVISS